MSEVPKFYIKAFSYTEAVTPPSWRQGDADYWTPAPNSSCNLFYNLGNIGIGIANPQEKLHVVGNILTTGTITASNISVIGDFVTLNTVTSNTEQMVITNAGTGPALKVTQSGINSVAEFYDNESGLALMIANNGNVGIGTTVPDAPLHVRPNTSTTGVIIDQVGSGGILDVRDGGVSKVVVDANGNVGIGTTNPLQKLQIEGNIMGTNGSIVKAQYYSGFASQQISTTDVTTHASVTFIPIHTGGRTSQIICQVFYRWYTGGYGPDTFEIRLTDGNNNELDYSRPFYEGASAGGGGREVARPMMGVQTTTSTNEIVFRLRFNRLVSDDSVTISNARFFVQQLV